MKIILSILIACACIFLVPGKSFADPERATVLIDNQTGKTIHYQLKWGADGQWKDYTLQAGYEMTHRKKYIPTGVPPPYIQFVAFSTFDGGGSKKYKLDIGWDNNPRRYHFEASNNTLYFYKD
jgi:hypothetical protein